MDQYSEAFMQSRYSIQQRIQNRFAEKLKKRAQSGGQGVVPSAVKFGAKLSSLELPEKYRNVTLEDVLLMKTDPNSIINDYLDVVCLICVMMICVVIMIASPVQ
jgi:hypothetical protein